MIQKPGVHLVARLRDAARDGQIFISSRIAAVLEDGMRVAEIGDLSLKRLRRAVAVCDVVQ